MTTIQPPLTTVSYSSTVPTDRVWAFEIAGPAHAQDPDFETLSLHDAILAPLGEELSKALLYLLNNGTKIHGLGMLQCRLVKQLRWCKIGQMMYWKILLELIEMGITAFSGQEYKATVRDLNEKHVLYLGGDPATQSMRDLAESKILHMSGWDARVKVEVTLAKFRRWKLEQEQSTPSGDTTPSRLSVDRLVTPPRSMQALDQHKSPLKAKGQQERPTLYIPQGPYPCSTAFNLPPQFVNPVDVQRPGGPSATLCGGAGDFHLPEAYRHPPGSVLKLVKKRAAPAEFSDLLHTSEATERERVAKFRAQRPVKRQMSSRSWWGEPGPLTESEEALFDEMVDLNAYSEPWPGTVKNPEAINNPGAVNNPRAVNNPNAVNKPKAVHNPKAVDDPEAVNNPQVVNNPEANPWAPTPRQTTSAVRERMERGDGVYLGL